MEMIIGRFLTPLKLLEDDGEPPSRRDDNSRGKVQNVRVDNLGNPDETAESWRELCQPPAWRTSIRPSPLLPAIGLVSRRLRHVFWPQDSGHIAIYGRRPGR